MALNSKQNDVENLFLKNVSIRTAPLLSHPHYYAAGSRGFLAALGQIADTGGTSEKEEMKVVTEGTGECREMDGSGTVPKTKTQRRHLALPCGQLRQSGIQRHLAAEQKICRALNRWLSAGR